MRRVSVSSTGGQALGGESTSPAISANGRFVAFQSRATNLVPGDTNGLMDVFVHDRDADGNGIFDEAGEVRTERVNLGLSDRHGVPVFEQAARRRQRRPGHQRQRPLRRVPVGGHQPARRRRHQPA